MRDCIHFIVIAIAFVICIFTFSTYYISLFGHFILYTYITFLTYGVSRYWCRYEKIQPENKAVLITGCDSGFGNLLARRLDSKGFHVFASCLFPDGAGASELEKSCSSRLKIFHMDVTKDETIEKASVFVKESLGSNELWAVVNNAGMAKAFSSFEFSSLNNFKETMDVNALGPVRVTKAFLPLLKESKGRIVNVTSLAGRIALTDACAYTMSKYAAVGLVECLSQEMKPWGIRVISIEPEMFRTGLTKDVIGRFRKEVDKVSKEILSSYGEEYIKDLEKFTTRFLSWETSKYSVVVDDMESAISLKNPCHVYKPRRNIFVRVLCYTLEILPFELYEKIVYTCVRICGYPIPKDAKTNNSN